MELGWFFPKPNHFPIGEEEEKLFFSDLGSWGGNRGVVIFKIFFSQNRGGGVSVLSPQNPTLFLLSFVGGFLKKSLVRVGKSTLNKTHI